MCQRVVFNHSDVSTSLYQHEKNKARSIFHSEWQVPATREFINNDMEVDKELLSLTFNRSIYQTMHGSDDEGLQSLSDRLR